MAKTPSKSARPRKSGKAGAVPKLDAPLADAPVTGDESSLRTNSIVARSGAFQEPPDRWAMIAVAAYFLAERRGFVSGHEHEDWLAAEREVDAALAKTGQ
jgi:hypothetical protein